MKHISIYLLFLLLIFSWSSFAQNKESIYDEKYYLSYIKAEQDSNNYRNVIKLVDEAIAKGIESNKLIGNRAIAYYKLKYNKKAFKDVEYILSDEEKEYSTFPIISLYYTENKDFYNAIETLIQFYEKENKAFFTSLFILNQKDVKKIIVAIDSSFAKEGYSEKLYAIKSIVNYSQNNFNDAYSDLITAIDKEQKNGFLYSLLGEIKLKRKEYISAVASYNSALLYGNNDIEVYKKRAVAKGFLDDFFGAIEDYNIIIAKNPKDFETYYLRAIAKNYLKDYNGAISDLNIAIKLKDTFPSAYNYRGIVYINLGDYASALMDFYKTLSINPNHPFTYNNIGISLVSSGQSIKAEQFFNKAIELDPKHADAYYNRGKLLFNKSDISKAKSDFLKSIELHFQNPDAHYHLALIYIQEKYKFPNKKLDEKICSELEIASKMNHPKAQVLLKQICQKAESIEEVEEEKTIEENGEEKTDKHIIM